MENKKLAPNFWFKEFMEGTALPIKAIRMNYEDFNESKMPELIKLAESLQFIRDCTKEKFGDKFKGFTITAGLRVKRWELERGRSGKSQHVNYNAADIQPICAVDDYMEIFNWIFETFQDTWKGGFAKKEPNLRAGKKGFIHIDNRGYKARWTY